MLVKIFVVVRGNVAAGVLLLNPVKPLGIDSHHVFVMAVQRALFHHPDLTIALNNLRLNLADLFTHQIAPVFFAGDDGFARFFYARGTKRIRLPRKTERRLGLFPGLQQRLIGPFWCNRRIWIFLIEMLNGVERNACGFAKNPIETPGDLRPQVVIRHRPLPSLFSSSTKFLSELPTRPNFPRAYPWIPYHDIWLLLLSL